MAKPNGWIRHSSNTSRFTVTISRTTGPNSCPSWSLCTTMLWVLLLECHHSLLTKVTTPTLLSIQNATWPLLELISTPLTSTPCMNSSVGRWPTPNSDTKDLWMPNGLQHLTSKLVTKHSSRLSTSALHDPQRSSLRRTLDHIQSSHRLAPTPLCSDSPTPWTLSILYSMSPNSNPLYLIQSQIEYNLCHLWLRLTVNPSTRFQRSWTWYEGTDDETSWLLTTELNHASFGIASSNQVQRQWRDEPVRKNTHLVLDTLASRLWELSLNCRSWELSILGHKDPA